MREGRVRIVFYRSAEDVFAAHMRSTLRAAGFKGPVNAEDWRIGGQGLDGKAVKEYGFRDAVRGMKLQGAWGYSDIPKKTIHLWAGARASKAIVLHMVAHELAHVRFHGTPRPKRRRGAMADEMEAEAIGTIAREAVPIAARLRRQAQARPK